jgi:hypothetical protein
MSLLDNAYRGRQQLVAACGDDYLLIVASCAARTAPRLAAAAAMDPAAHDHQNRPSCVRHWAERRHDRAQRSPVLRPPWYLCQ